MSHHVYYFTDDATGKGLFMATKEDAETAAKVLRRPSCRRHYNGIPEGATFTLQNMWPVNGLMEAHVLIGELAADLDATYMKERRRRWPHGRYRDDPEYRRRQLQWSKECHRRRVAKAAECVSI